MKILFATIAWPAKGERNLYSDLMDEFVRDGHIVYVLCADEKIQVTTSGIENGINILRVNTTRIRKTGKLKKALAFFNLGSRLKKEVRRSWPDLEIDLIISNSPPVILSGLMRFLKRMYNAPLYYMLKDIWPDGPADLKIIRKYGLVYYYFRIHEIRMYKAADYIGCMSQYNVSYLLKHNNFLSESKVEICPNTITPRTITLRNSRDLIRKKFNIPEQAVVFIFSGNIGRAHGLDFYLDAIEMLRDFDKAYFLIGGNGMQFNRVTREIKRRNLKNTGTYSRLPADDFDELLLSSDVGVILLDSKYNVPQFPSRLLSYLEAGKPVLCSVNNATDIGKTIVDAGCGVSTLHGDFEEFKSAVKFFCDPGNSETVEKMQSDSLKLLNQNFTSSVSYNTIIRHFVG